MNSMVRAALITSPPQAQRLVELQQAFAAVCNALVPLVQQTRCWNRVALHHMAYKQLRQKFPGMGSQMVCNAIYSVSRSCRIVYQHPRSPFNVSRLGDRALPRLQFQPQSPVYFDRHTLSIKSGQVSMYTLDGRMRFQLDLSIENEQRFLTDKLREIVLSAEDGAFWLTFIFGGTGVDPSETDLERTNPELPEYVVIGSGEPPNPLQVLSTVNAGLAT